MTNDKTWMWDTKNDCMQAEKLEEEIRKEIEEKLINSLRKYFENNEIMQPSDIFNLIKLVIKDDRHNS